MRLGCLLGAVLAAAVLPATAGARAGSHDTSFGNRGYVETDAPGWGAAAIFPQADGRLLVGGNSHKSCCGRDISGDAFVLSRWSSAGALESTSRATTGYQHFVVHAAIAGPGGRIVAAGGVANRNAGELGYDLALAAVGPDGALDPTFGDGGIVVTPGHDAALAAAFQPDGRIVVMPRGRILRYTASGALDDSWGNGGAVSTEDVNPVRGNSIAVQPDGRVLHAGAVWVGQGEETALTVKRYLPDGAPDPAFGNGGAVTHAHGAQTMDVHRILVDSGGRIALAGALDRGRVSGGFVARLTGQGALDASFGGGAAGDGIAAGLPGFPIRVLALVEREGMLYAAGQARDARHVAARLDGAGALDPAFGADGIAVVWADPPVTVDSAAIDSNGKLVVGGHREGLVSSSPPSSIALARLQTDPTGVLARRPRRLAGRGFRGVRLDFRCIEDCRVHATLTRGGERIGRAARRLDAGETGALRVRLSRAARRRLGDAKTARVGVHTSVEGVAAQDDRYRSEVTLRRR